MTQYFLQRLRHAEETARAALLAERCAQGYWVGELSASALSTATAVAALALVRRCVSDGQDVAGVDGAALSGLVGNGLGWLAEHQNDDGGWGDTTKSLSNISTTMLARAAFALAGEINVYETCVQRAHRYIQRAGGVDAVIARYGKDRTFAAPILMTCALAGQAPWQRVAALPFELACLPSATFKWLKLPVVSYALPALIAVGQVKFVHDPPRWGLLRGLRRCAGARSLQVLESIQPSSGGFLEATPLTSFVTMALVGMGRPDHAVVRRAVRFLAASVRPEGSWPIDSNLCVWLTTLSIHALCSAGAWGTRRYPTDRSSHALLGDREREELRRWLLDRQFRTRHPYTSSPPGGWGWTDLPGSVPDADDTAGALLALHDLGATSESRQAAACGVGWLLGLQNRDGGWPTFCRGWGNLPFDRSGADLTAHVLRALAAWREELGGYHPHAQDCSVASPRFQKKQLDRAVAAGFGYLQRQQRADGAWLPLWFGNQHAPGEESPTYGTARVSLAYLTCHREDDPPARRGRAWLLKNQNPDGGWGAGHATASSLEETALALEALASARQPEGFEACRRGAAWLVERIEAGELTNPSPIGFYFAKLWYFERLYPIIFAVAAFRRLVPWVEGDKTMADKPSDQEPRLLQTQNRV